MRRVRDELALRPCRLLERAEHGVEAACEPAELVAPALVDAFREVAGLGHVLGRSSQAAHRGERSPRDREAQRNRERDPAARDQDEQILDSAERVVDFGQRTRDLNGDAGHVREREHADMRTVDVRVREVRTLPVTSDRDDLLVDRQGHSRAWPQREDFSVRTDYLRVTRGAAELGGRGCEVLEVVHRVRASCAAVVLSESSTVPSS